MRVVHEEGRVPGGPLAAGASGTLRIDLLLQSLQRATLPLNGTLLIQQGPNQALVVRNAVELIVVFSRFR